MTALTVAQPLLESVYAILQDATLQTAIGGRMYDDIPQDTPRPVVLLEVLDERDIRGLGTGGLPEIDLRVHTFSEIGSMSEARAINGMVVALLKDAAIQVAGFTQAGLIVYRTTVALQDELLFGVKVHEVVSLYTVWCEQVGA